MNSMFLRKPRYLDHDCWKCVGAINSMEFKAKEQIIFTTTVSCFPFIIMCRQGNIVTLVKLRLKFSLS